MLLSVHIQEEVDYSTLQAGANALVENIASAGNLYAAFKVQNAQAFAQIPVSLGLEIKFSGLAPGANNGVAAIILANGYILGRHIRNGQKDCLQAFFDFLQLLVVLGNFIAQCTNSSHFFGSILTCFFQLANLLRSSITLLFQGFNLLSQLTTLFVQL